MRILKRQLH